MRLAAALKPRAILLPLVHHLFHGEPLCCPGGRHAFLNDGESECFGLVHPRCLPNPVARPYRLSLAFCCSPTELGSFRHKLISSGAL